MFIDLIQEDALEKNNSEHAKWFKDETGKVFFIENKTGRKRFAKLKVCENCSNEYCTRFDEAKYCSRDCAREASKVERIKIHCANCNNELLVTKHRLRLSKKGFNFCDRKCKEKAQEIGGIAEIQPGHYGDGTTRYAKKAFKYYGEKCVDCDMTFKPLLEVHHIDGNRNNSAIENLEVVCKNHHLLRHLKFDSKTGDWSLDFKCLTPREKLNYIMKKVKENMI